MATNRWTPSKGREIEDLTNKINELMDLVANKGNQTGNLKSYQILGTVKKDNGDIAVQFKDEKGNIIESDNTSATGFKII